MIRLALLLCFASLACGQPGVSLLWDRNSEPAVTGYKVGVGTASGNYTTFVDVGDTTSARVPIPIDTTAYLAVLAYDKDGLESEWSNEVVFTPTKESTLAGFYLGVLPVNFITTNGATEPGIRYTLPFYHTPGEPAHTTLIVDVYQGEQGYVDPTAVPVRLPKRSKTAPVVTPRAVTPRSLVNISPPATTPKRKPTPRKTTKGAELLRTR